VEGSQVATEDGVNKTREPFQHSFQQLH